MPGIDITKLKIGTVVFVETEDDHLFELVVVAPARGVVEVSATAPRLKQSVVGVLTHSSAEKEAINHWVGPGMCMALLFKNGNYESKPVRHATVRGELDGKKWSIDVF